MAIDDGRKPSRFNLVRFLMIVFMYCVVGLLGFRLGYKQDVHSYTERVLLERKIDQLDAAIGALYEAQTKRCLQSWSNDERI